MDLEGIILSEISQNKKEKYIYMESKKQNRNRHINTENRWLPKGKGWGHDKKKKLKLTT